MDADVHLRAVVSAPSLVVVYADTGAGLATFGAILAGWKIRRSFVRADTAVNARPHSAALRRLTVRFPDQVATDALNFFNSGGTWCVALVE